MQAGKPPAQKRVGGYTAAKSDYVLAKGPDGKRVWIHKTTGEIRTSLPTASDGASVAPAAAPAVASAASVSSTDQFEDFIKKQLQASVADMEAKLMQEMGPGKDAPPPTSAQAAVALQAPPFSDEKAGRRLVDVNFELLPSNELLGEDYELMAGRITTVEYNAKLQIYATQRAENAAAMEAASAAAAQAAALAAASAGVPPNMAEAMANLVNMGLDPTALMAQMAANYAASAPEAEEAPVYEEGMDVAMAAQLMQLNRFHLQQRVFDTQKNIASGDMPTRFKEGFRPMQLCKQFVKSASCVRGESCSYAHTMEELHPMSSEIPGAESSKAVEALAEQMEEATPTIAPIERMQRKRAMCQRLTRGGCLLGSRCPFAHNEAELGTVSLAITDRVKTALCKFWEQKKCVYGKYCVNAHGAHEIGKPKPDYLVPPSKQNKTEGGLPDEPCGGHPENRKRR